jgi:AraC family transcriptional regulator
MISSLTPLQLEMPKKTPLASGRRLVTWRGLAAERIQITGSDELHYRYLGPRHYVCLHDIRKLNGEMFVQGVLIPQLLDLRNKITFVPRDCEVSGWSKLSRPHNSITAVYFDPQILDDELDRTFSAHCNQPMVLFEDTGLRSTLGKLSAVLSEDGPVDPLYGETLGLLAALEISRLQTTGLLDQIRDTGRLSFEHERRIRLFIDENLHRNMSLSELADVVNLSRFHFTRSFKKTLGQPPHQFILHQRVERAKESLLSSELSIGEIAQSLGFGNQGRFASSFRKVTGLTPAYFRRIRR